MPQDLTRAETGLRDWTGWLTRQSIAHQSGGLKFPENREFNREFWKFRPLAAKSSLISRGCSAAYSQIPCAQEQGIFTGRTGKAFRGTGNFGSLFPFLALLLCPRIGERARQPGDGEAGRGCGVDDCGYDLGRHEGEGREVADVALDLAFAGGDLGKAGGAAFDQIIDP